MDDYNSPRITTPKKRKSLIDIFKIALTSDNQPDLLLNSSEEIKIQELKIQEKILHYSTEKEKKNPNFKTSKLPKPEYFSSAQEIREKIILTQKALSNLCKTSYIRKHKEGFPKVPVILVLETPHRKGFASKKNDLSRADCSVSIGVWRFNFNPFSLCLPKIQNGTNNALLCLQVGEVELNDEFMNDISEFLLDWNTMYPYNSQFSHYSFAKSLLSKIGIQFDPKDFKDPFKTCFEIISENGPERFLCLFHIPDGILKQEKNRKVEFKTHKELDLFLEKIVNPDFIKNYPVHYEYLRALDDTFWLKHYKAREEIDDLVDDFTHPENCIFGDPRERGAFLHPDKTLTQKKFVVV